MNGSKQNVQDYLKLLFQNVSITGIGDASGLLASATAGSLYVRLCTDATAIDIETLGSECSYTGYVAGGIAVARNSTKWGVSWNDTDNQAEVINNEEEVFGERTDTGAVETVQFAELWKDSSSTDIGDRLMWLEFTTTFDVSQGTMPRFGVGKLKWKFK